MSRSRGGAASRDGRRSDRRDSAGDSRSGSRRSRIAALAATPSEPDSTDDGTSGPEAVRRTSSRAGDIRAGGRAECRADHRDCNHAAAWATPWSQPAEPMVLPTLPSAVSSPWCEALLLLGVGSVDAGAASDGCLSGEAVASVLGEQPGKRACTCGLAVLPPSSTSVPLPALSAPSSSLPPAGGCNPETHQQAKAGAARGWAGTTVSALLKQGRSAMKGAFSARRWLASAAADAAARATATRSEDPSISGRTAAGAEGRARASGGAAAAALASSAGGALPSPALPSTDATADATGRCKDYTAGADTGSAAAPDRVMAGSGPASAAAEPVESKSEASLNPLLADITTPAKLRPATIRFLSRLPATCLRPLLRLRAEYASAVLVSETPGSSSSSSSLSSRAPAVAASGGVLDAKKHARPSREPAEVFGRLFDKAVAAIESADCFPDLGKLESLPEDRASHRLARGLETARLLGIAWAPESTRATAVKTAQALGRAQTGNPAGQAGQGGPQDDKQEDDDEVSDAGKLGRAGALVVARRFLLLEASVPGAARKLATLALASMRRGARPAGSTGSTEVELPTVGVVTSPEVVLRLCLAQTALQCLEASFALEHGKESSARARVAEAASCAQVAATLLGVLGRPAVEGFPSAARALREAERRTALGGTAASASAAAASAGAGAGAAADGGGGGGSVDTSDDPLGCLLEQSTLGPALLLRLGAAGSRLFKALHLSQPQALRDPSSPARPIVLASAFSPSPVRRPGRRAVVRQRGGHDDGLDPTAGVGPSARLIGPTRGAASNQSAEGDGSAAGRAGEGLAPAAKRARGAKAPGLPSTVVAEPKRAGSKGGWPGAGLRQGSGILSSSSSWSEGAAAAQAASGLVPAAQPSILPAAPVAGTRRLAPRLMLRSSSVGSSGTATGAAGAGPSSATLGDSGADPVAPSASQTDQDAASFAAFAPSVHRAGVVSGVRARAVRVRIRPSLVPPAEGSAASRGKAAAVFLEAQRQSQAQSSPPLEAAARSDSGLPAVPAGALGPTATPSRPSRPGLVEGTPMIATGGRAVLPGSAFAPSTAARDARARTSPAAAAEVSRRLFVEQMLSDLSPEDGGAASGRSRRTLS